MSRSVRQQFADTMLAIGQEDPNLVVLVGDISHGVLKPYAAACPGRYYNVGICEPTIVSMAAGLSRVGFRPVVHTIAPFLIERSFEQIKLDFCYQNLPGNIVTVGGTFDYSNLGCTHHCYGDIALLKTLPSVQIFYPGSCTEFDVLFRAAYANDCLSVYRIPGFPHGQDIPPDQLDVGKGVRVRDGSDLSIVTTGGHLKTALESVPSLSAMGWDPEIIYIHTVRPLDTELIQASAARTGRVLVVEEHMRSGGLGDDVLRATMDLPNVHHSLLSIPDSFVAGYGSYDHHCRELGLTKEGILERVRRDFSGDP